MDKRQLDHMIRTAEATRNTQSDTIRKLEAIKAYTQDSQVLLREAMSMVMKGKYELSAAVSLDDIEAWIGKAKDLLGEV